MRKYIIYFCKKIKNTYKKAGWQKIAEGNLGILAFDKMSICDKAMLICKTYRASIFKMKKSLSGFIIKKP